MPPQPSLFAFRRSTFAPPLIARSVPVALPEILPNGLFRDTGTPPTRGAGVTVSGGRVNCTAAGQIVTWSNVLIVGARYQITLKYNCTSGSKLRINNSATNAFDVKDAQAVTADGVTRSITFWAFIADGTDFSVEADTAAFTGWVAEIVAIRLADEGILPNGDFLRFPPPPTLYTGAAATQGSVAYTSGGALAGWTGVLTVGQKYSIAVTYTCTSGSKLRISNSATDGTTVVDIQSVITGGLSQTVTFATFTATSADLTLGADTAFFTGSIINVVATVVVSGTVWQFISSVAASWSETSLTFDRTRAFVSAAAEAWAESSALSRLRGVVSSATQAWTETAQFGRIRAFTSSVAAAWAESSTLTRIRALASSVVAAAWSEASSLVRIRGFVAANGATWAETSSLIRTRGFSSARGSVWSETATFSRTRRFVSSATAVWGELSTFAAGTIIQLTATGGFVWSETGNAPARKRGFVATSGSTWVEAAALSRKAGLVSTTGAVWSEAAALSRKLALANATGQMTWAGDFRTVGILALLHSQAMMLFGEQSQFTGGIFRIYGPVVKFTFEVNPFPPPARDEDRPINF